MARRSGLVHLAALLVGGGAATPFVLIGIGMTHPDRPSIADRVQATVLDPAFYNTPRARALAAARSASEQVRDETIRAEVLLRDENDRLRTQINRDAKEHGRIIGAMGAEHLRNRGALVRENAALAVQLADLRRKFEASQLLADQAIKERDEWHSAYRVEHLKARKVLDRLTSDLRAELAAMTEQRDQAVSDRDVARAVPNVG